VNGEGCYREGLDCITKSSLAKNRIVADMDAVSDTFLGLFLGLMSKTSRNNRSFGSGRVF